jgi:predicted AAA+ superfamily ATPase
MISREDYLKTLRTYQNKDLIKVVTGIRRAGKSTLLELFRQELLRNGIKPANIQAINFELPEYTRTTDWRKIYNFIKAKFAKTGKNYIFLDEVQNIPKFEKLADGLYASKNVDLYITGSNAYFLSSELATLLAGRYIELKILPLSFKEYVSAFKDNKSPARRFADYINYGSFPYVAELLSTGTAEIDRYLAGIYDTVLYKDILAKLQPGDATKIENVTRFMFDNIGNITSPGKIANTMTSLHQKISHPTVDAYLKTLTDSFVLYPVRRYDIKGKKLLQTLNKYYVVDTGLREMLLGRDNTADRGHILENIVYLELLRRNQNVWTGKETLGEVDFVVRTKAGYTEYYQVTETMLGKETRARELRPLDVIADHNPKYIITLDAGEYSYNGIKQINAIDWLLGL